MPKQIRTFFRDHRLIMEICSKINKNKSIPVCKLINKDDVKKYKRNCSAKGVAYDPNKKYCVNMRRKWLVLSHKEHFKVKLMLSGFKSISNFQRYKITART